MICNDNECTIPRPLLHSYAVDAIMEGNTIKGILMESKSGRRAIMADRVIDCTGDADIAHFAGAEYRKTSKVVQFLISISIIN